jgi:hypothetical protein
MTIGLQVEYPLRLGRFWYFPPLLGWWGDDAQGPGFFLGRVEATKIQMMDPDLGSFNLPNCFDVGLRYDMAHSHHVPRSVAGDAVFDVDGAHDLVAVREIPFHSLCEHLEFAEVYGNPQKR